MAKKKYRLQALLTIKERVKKRAEIALAKSIVALKKAKDKLEELKEEKKKIIEKWKECRAEMKAKLAGGAFVAEGNVHVNFLRKLKEDETAKEEEIEDQKIVISECEANVVRCRQDYIDAAREVQIMQKHKELWEKKVREEITSKEEKELDELGGTIHQLRKWRGEKSAMD